MDCVCGNEGGRRANGRANGPGKPTRVSFVIMMYVMYTKPIMKSHNEDRMVRKQLYITAVQERVIKATARETGLTEAEIVREALQAYLFRRRSDLGPQSDHRVKEFFAAADRLAAQIEWEPEYRFERDEVYRERLTRIDRRQDEETR